LVVKGAVKCFRRRYWCKRCMAGPMRRKISCYLYLTSCDMLQEKVLVHVVPLNREIFGQLKEHIKRKDSDLPLLTAHPRFIRWTGFDSTHSQIV
jgi:hypothetical protein